MIFLMLFRGRPPFWGRFSGAGDMPIGRVIEEGRFVYGRRRPWRGRPALLRYLLSGLS
jgi:hypothetical protein